MLRMTALHEGDVARQTIVVRRSGELAIEWRAVSNGRWLELERSGDTLVLAANPAGLLPGTFADTVHLIGAQLDSLAHIAVSFHVGTAGVGQVVATELPWSWGVAVNGGRILQASYGWDMLGLRPRPRLLQLWEGSSHPQTLARLPADALYAPIVDANDGATFVLARATDGNFLYQIDGDGDARLIASRIGTEPAYGAAVMPDGSIAVAEWNGDISRVQRDGRVSPWMKLGTNVYQIASDAAGNLYAATYDGLVVRVNARGDRRTITTGFGEGRLVAITTTPEGDVIAAERGGQGRIVRIRSNGTRDLVYRSQGARFYGLALDAGFLYALDLKKRELLRIPLPGDDQAVAAHRPN
jgi:hypothetical protein